MLIEEQFIDLRLCPLRLLPSESLLSLDAASANWALYPGLAAAAAATRAAGESPCEEEFKCP